MSFSLSEYTKTDVSWGFAPDPTGGAYNAPPDPLAGFKEPLHGRRGMKGRTRGGERKGGRGMGKGGERGKWGIAPCLLGDRCPE